MHVNIRGLSCNLVCAQVGARKCLSVQPRAAFGACSSALRGHAFVPSSSKVSRRASPAWPNHSLKLTRYGIRCKPGALHSVHLCAPGLHRMPSRSA